MTWLTIVAHQILHEKPSKKIGNTPILWYFCTSKTIKWAFIMADNEIIDRIKYLMKEQNVRQIDFAKKIDVDPSNLSKYLNGHLAISDSLLNRIVVNLGVSKEWLEHGTDLPFAKQLSPKSHQVTQSVDNAGMQGVPVYDIDVTAGNMPRSQLFAQEHIAGSICLPDLIAQDCRIVHVSGDSMTPVIDNGDLIAVREVSNTQYIVWGRIYVVTLEDMRLVKYVRKHSDPNMVILRSANPDYDDIEVKRSDILDLMQVESVIHIYSHNFK